MVASVVFPNPGGPNNNTWSSASPRDFAASSAIASCSFAFVCPINSASRVGRSFGSNAASSSTRPAETNRSASTDFALFRSIVALFLKESTQGDTKAKPRTKQPLPQLVVQRQHHGPMRRKIHRQCIQRPQFLPHPQVAHVVLRTIDKPILRKGAFNMHWCIAEIEHRQIAFIPVSRHRHPGNHIPILLE